MSFIPRTVSRQNVFVLFLIALLAWPVIGQESVLEQLIPGAPLFSIVAPFQNDIVVGDVVFIIKPLVPLSRATVSLTSPPSDFKSDLSADNSYSSSWSSASVDDGSYTFEFEACDDVQCETRSLTIVVKNNTVSSEPTGSASEVPSPPVPSSSDNPPASSTNSSSDDSSSRISVTPSNFFGLFSLHTPSSSKNSSGDDFKITPDKYSIDAQFINDDLVVTLSNVFLDASNIIFFLEKNSVDSFSLNGSDYSVSSSLSIDIPYSFDVGSFDFFSNDSSVLA